MSQGVIGAMGAVVALCTNRHLRSLLLHIPIISRLIHREDTQYKYQGVPVRVHANQEENSGYSKGAQQTLLKTTVTKLTKQCRCGGRKPMRWN
jgi:hypothetical protein